MRQVGFWRGSEKSRNPDESPELPRVEDFVDISWPSDERISVIEYVYHPDLDAKTCRGISRCRLCGEVNGNQTFNDGAWEWPSGLLHYVGRHWVRPPQEFIDHCVRQRK